MKLSYDKQTDVAYIHLKQIPIWKSFGIVKESKPYDNIIIDYLAKSEVFGVEIMDATYVLSKTLLIPFNKTSDANSILNCLSFLIVGI